jgi:hypothetical protein
MCKAAAKNGHRLKLLIVFDFSVFTLNGMAAAMWIE